MMKITGKLTIEDKNEVENGKIKWQKNKPQEYIVTYIYSAKVYENIKDQSIKLNYQLDSELALYSNKDITVKAKATVEKEQKEKLGEIAEVIIENPTNEDIYKGYMYNNKVTAEENKRETEIANRYTLNIAYSNLIDSFTISQNDDKFTTSKEQEYKANTYNKELKISKQEFDKDNNTMFLVGGAKDVPYEEVIKALNLLHLAGIKSVGLMTNPI